MNSLNLLISLISDLIKNEKNLNEDKYNNYKICHDICKKLVQNTNVPLIVNGVENIPEENPVLIISNHTSFYDIFVLVSIIERYITFAAAKELNKYPILNKYITSIDCILIDRNTEDLKLMKEQLTYMQNAVKNGLILFPEGECSYMSDDIKEFKKGGFITANKEDVTIVPTYIHYSSVKKIGKWFVPNDEMKVIFGKSFKPSEISENKINAKFLSEYSRERVLELKRSI